ncbi:MAG: pyrroline-5-carboxylate reductase [Phycisphaerales bacterium]
MPEQNPYLALIGGGNMARAIVQGGLAAGVLEPARTAVAEPEASKREWFAARGVLVHTSAACALEWLEERDAALASEPRGQVLLAIKPQSLGGLSDELVRERGTDAFGAFSRRIVISVLAGVPTRVVRRLLGGACAVVRAMPNTPAQVGEGVTAIAAGAGASPGDAAFCERLFRGVGPVVHRCDESLMDAYTGLAASGPAYVYYLGEAMVRAAVKAGLGEEDARAAVRQMIIGAGTLLKRTEDPFEALRAAVTSKGGTTEAAIRVLDERGTAGAIVSAIDAARGRGRELGEAFERA